MFLSKSWKLRAIYMDHFTELGGSAWVQFRVLSGWSLDFSTMKTVPPTLRRPLLSPSYPSARANADKPRMAWYRARRP